MEQLQQFFYGLGPIGNVILAIILLGVGIIIARIVAGSVRRLLRRTQLDDRLGRTISESTGIPQFNMEELISRVVFWLIMLFVAVGVLNIFNLTSIATPINAFLQRVTTVYLPNLVGAIVLLGVAWLIASVLRFLVSKAANILKLDERLTKHGALEEGEQVAIGDSLATAVFWFVFLLFLPAVLQLLGISAVAGPIQSIFDQAVGFIPNILGAIIIFIIGWFIARIVRQIVSNVLAAIGVDSIGARVGLSGERAISKLVGTFLYTIILLYTIVSALDNLEIEAVSGPATRMLDIITTAIPAVLGAALVLAISYFIGRLIANLITDLLTGVGFDLVLQRIGLNMAGTRTPSQLVGYLILIAIMLFAAVSAAELLGSEFLSVILTAFLAFLGQLVLAVIIFAIGLYLANLARTVILSAGGEGATFTASLARIAILVLAGAMSLRQLGIADDIVNLAFGLLLGALAVAAALAFGLGSRDIAGREVERFVNSLRSPDDIID
jgi:hypothetical protein